MRTQRRFLSPEAQNIYRETNKQMLAYYARQIFTAEECRFVLELAGAPKPPPELELRALREFAAMALEKDKVDTLNLEFIGG